MSLRSKLIYNNIFERRSFLKCFFPPFIYVLAGDEKCYHQYTYYYLCYVPYNEVELAKRRGKKIRIILLTLYFIPSTRIRLDETR